MGGDNGQRLSKTLATKEDDSRRLAGEFKRAATAVTAEMQAMPREKRALGLVCEASKSSVEEGCEGGGDWMQVY